MNQQYNPAEIEKKWQEIWREKRVYEVKNSDEGYPLGKYYVLDMFPYPSGEGLHVGHPRGYVGSDVYARFKRLQGYNVLHPMGFDSFGLPAEQFAIKTGQHPGPHTDQLIERYKSQLEMIGMSYDWDRAVATHRPEFYKWTQWIFIRLFSHYFDTALDKAMPISELVARFEREGNSSVTAAMSPDAPIFTAEEWGTYSEKERADILMKYRLAFEGFAEVNWCPELGTVLANDEIVTNAEGKMVSERGDFPVYKKKMRQMFLRITAYADRLLSGLDSLDWSENIKQIQRNWIGRSEGVEIEFGLLPLAEGGREGVEVTQIEARVTVFTTRADTLYGVTYIVLAPEHPTVQTFRDSIENWSEVESYIKHVNETAEDDRIASKEKTGVELRGVMAKHPVTGEMIPVWISDYVLASYGTGAVMAVPAHDERDWEFANKYGLSVKRVIECLDINTGPGADAYRASIEEIERNNVVCIIEHPTENKFLCADWKQVVWRGFVTGGIEPGMSPEDAARAEVQEETGYKNIAEVRVFEESTHGLFYHVVKKHNRLAHYRIVYVKLADLEQDLVDEAEQAIADFVWIDANKVRDFVLRDDMKFAWDVVQGRAVCFTNKGILVNSGECSGMKSDDAITAIAGQVNGRIVTKYKMRDAIFARQRYWGEPIPLRYDAEGIVSELSDSELPLTLPDITEYLPTETGEPPLARSQVWVDAGYEQNTMPGWAGSSWYWMRYMDPHNTEELAGAPAKQYWGAVDMYVGGREHATGHLLYSRFWNKFLYDIGVAPTDEPFQAMRNQGLILASDGRKMSKRWGNTVTPDEMVERFGADSFRLYECFIGPFDASQPWIVDGVVGCRRFVEKVWRIALVDNNHPLPSPPPQGGGNKEGTGEGAGAREQTLRVLHKTLKKVTEDIGQFKFNTAVAALMECCNSIEVGSLDKEEKKILLTMISPFAPHVAEELWSGLGFEGSVIKAKWPQYEESFVVDSEVTIAVSVNGKPRDTVSLPVDSDEESVLIAAQGTVAYKKWVGDSVIKKIIFVPNKIINIIV